MSIESLRDLEGLKAAGRVVRLALEAMRAVVEAGVTTGQLDAIGASVLAAHGARSAPNLTYGFPGANCISVNDEAVHGVPGDRRLDVGDLVKLDVTAELDGYMADAAVTVPVSPAEHVARALCRCAERALSVAMTHARAGSSTRDIGRAVEYEVERCNFRVLRELSGHGIGRTIHEPPSVPNYDFGGRGTPLTAGLVITIEPIIAVGTRQARPSGDGWTILTADGSLSAHFEHTVVIRADAAPLVLTAA
jgi:methionyl aminopeptidase